MARIPRELVYDPRDGRYSASRREEAKRAHTDAGPLNSVVPGKGIEPPLPCGNRILSPARLPISPPRLEDGSIANSRDQCNARSTPKIARYVSAETGRVPSESAAADGAKRDGTLSALRTYRTARRRDNASGRSSRKAFGLRGQRRSDGPRGCPRDSDTRLRGASVRRCSG